MLLRTTLTSPFGRKVRMAAMRMGLDKDLAIEPANPMNPDDRLRKDNPLGKMPVLVLDDGRRIHDSRVILEYLDLLAGGFVILPRDPKHRVETLTTQALADGITDAALLITYEGRYRPPELSHSPWLDYQREKIVRGLDLLSHSSIPDDDFTVGPIAVSAMLGYLDWRQPVDWRATHPKIAEWLDAFRANTPEYDATAAAPT